MRDFHTLPPLSLYVHLPWCLSKCPYCDFNSHARKTDIPERQYVDAVLADLEQELPDVWGRSLHSIFIGGGTPSLFSAAALDRLLAGIRALFVVPPQNEITLEANPGTVEQARFGEYRAIGINRLSIGVQSFSAAALQRLGRVHSAAEARRAVEIAHRAGFGNINLDLMYALPEQTREAALADVAEAIALAPTHISLYELTLEPNTWFARFPPSLPDDEFRWAVQQTAIDALGAAGYKRYEISAFACADNCCAHNVNYWQFGDYVGVGAGAHGKISRADTGLILRRSKQRHPERYLALAAGAGRIGRQHEVPIADTALEFMMNALRLIEGFPLPLFRTHTGIDLDPWQRTVDTAMDQGLLEQHGLNLCASARGLELLNDVLALFMTPAEQPRYPLIPVRVV